MLILIYLLPVIQMVMIYLFYINIEFSVTIVRVIRLQSDVSLVRFYLGVGHFLRAYLRGKPWPYLLRGLGVAPVTLSNFGTE